MKIGIDFGSTYSTISAFFPKEDRVSALSLVEGEPASIPSVVSISKKGKVTCGKAAKDQAGKHTVRIFEAFKMLLNESNQALLRQRGYDEDYTPRSITRVYLDSLLQGMLTRYTEDRFEEVVVCIPEIWSRNVETLDGRSILRDVLQELDYVGHVRVVTEPEAASAYFAYHYEQETGKVFNGHLLLIDYGGGTLDITLTQVCSDGRGNMEISFRESGGAGENHDGTLGSAGIAYMQRVVALALMEQEQIKSLDQVDYTNPEFVGAVRDLESQLKSPNRMKEIEDYFGSFGSGYQELRQVFDDDPEEFISLEYEGEELPVNYQTLLTAYQQTIESVLLQQITDINHRVQSRIGANPCEPAAGMRDDFKIALVGGFGSFYLVKKQLAEIYKLDANEKIDLRTKNIHADKREQAISLGAALLAAGKVEQKKTARYSIGLWSASTDLKFRINYGIRCHQDVEPEHPYYILSDSKKPDTPANRKKFAALYKNIRDFVISFTNDENIGVLIPLKPEMLRRLDKIPKRGVWNCGFSMDENDIVRFHIAPDKLLGAPGSTELVIPLDDYTGMFELAEVKEVRSE